MVRPLVAKVLRESRNIFGSPYRCARPEFYGLGIAPVLAAFPPCASADGEDGKDLGQTKKTVSGDG